MSERRQEILETLATELSVNPGKRITTAALAKSVGVSEAALYRHFPSKARMFEGLIEFAEDSIFTRINKILEDDRNTRNRCAKVVYLLLGFTFAVLYTFLEAFWPGSLYVDLAHQPSGRLDYADLVYFSFAVQTTLGFGDVTLAGLIGLIFGFPMGIVALFAGIFIGGLFGIGLLIARRKRKLLFPYGVFLGLGPIITLFAGTRIFDWYWGLF